MKTLMVAAVVLLVSPAWAQTNLAPKKNAAAGVDNCAPIGRTSDGKLVYSLKCDVLPVPPPSAQTEVREAAPPPPPQPEIERSGLFGWSYTRKNPND